MNTRFYIAIGQIMLPDYKNTNESREECLKAGKCICDIYRGNIPAKQFPRDLGEKITAYAHYGLANATILNLGYEKLVSELGEREFVISFMLDACNKILHKLNFTDEKISALTKGNDDEKKVKTLIDAVLANFPSMPSLTNLAAIVVASNKPVLITALSNRDLPDCLFFQFPNIEVNEERFLKCKLTAFLDTYNADVLEIKVTSFLLQLMHSKIKFHDKLKELLEFITKGSVDYSDHMLIFLCSPLMDVAQSATESGVDEEEFHARVKFIVGAYQPQTPEGMCIHRLFAILNSKTAAKDLHALLADNELKSKTSEALTAKLRVPLIGLVKDYNQFIKDKRSNFMSVKP